MKGNGGPTTKRKPRKKSPDQRRAAYREYKTTERRRIKETLREREARYRSLVENSPSFIGILQDGVLKYVNHTACERLGWSLEELLAPTFDPLERLVTEKFRNLVRENVGRRLRGDENLPYEITLMTRNGQEIPVMAYGTTISNEGHPAIEISLTDISEWKGMEEELRRSEERYRSLFDQTLDGVYLSTHAGRFVEVNPAFVKMFGYYNKQEMMDITDIKKELYFSPEERGSHVLDTGKEEVEAYQMRRKDGSAIWVEDHGRYIHDELGNVVYHEGILRDVSERKRLEDELKQYSTHLEELVKERTEKLAESEARFRRLFESSPISLWEEDFAEVRKYFDDLRGRGVRDFRRFFLDHPEDIAKCAALVKIVDVNEATLNLYGAKSVEELTGELRKYLGHEYRDTFLEELLALSQGNTRFTSEFENIVLSGATKHVSVMLNVVPGYENTLSKVIVSVVDLTERKAMERRLQQTERLAAVGETAAMVGHDLRNPLQGIAAAVHLLRNESLTSKERDEMLQVIEKSLEHADAIIRDLADYSADIQLRLTAATPKSILMNALGTVRIPESISLRDLSQDRPTLRVDAARLRRVFVNLIENAIDAMPQGGTLTLNSIQSDKALEIALSDTGSGMQEKVVENLWKPLQTTKAQGLGLGLAICKRVVDAHGGKISVKTKIGEGTTVTVRLPIESAAEGVR